jgi:S-formylglutathione hydrolase FrmB
MNKLTRVFLLVALVFALGYVPAATIESLAASASQANATQAKQTDSHLHTIQFESKLVGKTLPYIVVLPTDYDQPAAKDKHYPVLYLLHGLTGHYDNWITRTKLSEYAAQYSLIIVTPEGNDGWYTDSATVPTDKYETYIFEELIPDVQRRYRTVETREGRAIAGLSMGGYGALKLGVKHPEMFAFVGSLSGALGAATVTESDLHGLQSIWRTLALVFGPTDNPMRKANDVPQLYRNLPASSIAGLPYVYFDCGTEDPLLTMNRSFADLLVSRKIPHEYRQLPGSHSWPYWDAQVQEVLRIAARKLQQPIVSK